MDKCILKWFGNGGGEGRLFKYSLAMDDQSDFIPPIEPISSRSESAPGSHWYYDNIPPN